MKKPSVVVVGGGTGTHNVLKGLCQFANQIDITAIISMADSGGSTGRLRDEFGQLPVGDVRMALTALARDYNGHEELLRELFLYRFQQGNGLSGHSFGNLLLTALTDILGSESEAVKAAGRILRIQGKVLPVTYDNVHLVAKYDDGVIVTGEHEIDEPPPDRYDRKIVELGTAPIANISTEAKLALKTADLVVIGPGDLYSSLLANLVVKGMSEAIGATQGKVVFVANLMERLGQTKGMSVKDSCDELARYLGRQPDYLLVNKQTLPVEAVEYYQASEGTKPVIDDSNTLQSVAVIKTDLLQADLAEKVAGDSVKRSLIRHDSEKLANAIMTFL